MGRELRVVHLGRSRAVHLSRLREPTSSHVRPHNERHNVGGRMWQLRAEKGCDAGVGGQGVLASTVTLLPYGGYMLLGVQGYRN